MHLCHKISNTVSKIIFFLLLFASNSYEIDTEPQSKIQPNKTKDKLTVYQDEEDARSSLVFVFDTTGSMHNDLKQLREGAEMILDTALEESDVIADFVFVPFHDPAVGPATVTKDKEVFKSALDLIRVYGGGDCPEKSLSGIQLALNVSRARSHVYVFTDATASDHRLVGKVLDAVQRKQSQVVFVLTGHCNDLDRPSYKVYQQIAAASSGQVFNLNKTNVHKVLDFVRSSIKGRTVNLDSSINPPGYNHSQGIPVDSTLNEVTVSISGSKPQIKVVNPRGEEVSGPPQLITTLDLAEIVIVKVLQPEPGNWTITTGSEDSYSVKVVGTSNLTFNHGFSVSKPGSMAETSYRPLQGAYNHLMISLTQTDRPVQIKYAEIQSLDGKTLFEIPLKEIDKDRKIYLTEAFLPPDDFFYIAINGRDEYNQDLRRIGATAIQAKTPDVPYLTVPQKIEARIHESVVLKCKVESLVPVTAFWSKEGERSLQDKVSSLQSTSVNFVIEDLKDENAGKYKCVAKNVAGVSQSYTTVVMLVDPPQLIIEPFNKTIPLGGTFDIICTAKSDSVLLKFDLYFNGVKIEQEYEINIDREGYIGSKHRTFNNVTQKNSGIYTCVAENKGGGESSVSTTITVQSNPIAQIIGPHTITKPIHSTIQLVCRIENADEVVWMSNNSVVRKLDVNGSVIDMYDIREVSGDGIWSCMAVREGRMATDSVEITVLIKPEVLIEGDKNISVLNGSTCIISCLIRAKPQPRILWHRETEDFLNNTITLESPNLYKSELILNSSNESVNGTYFCIGENSEGIGQDNVVVTVRRPMTLVRGFTDTQVKFYSQVELDCRIDALPTPQIQWYHNSTHLKITKNLRLSNDNSTLYILSVDFQELGLYSCEAENGFEKLRVDGSLIANDLETPVLFKDTTHITTQKGNSTKITCRLIKGKPQPKVTWQYKTDASDVFTTLPPNVIWSANDLKILKVETNNMGIYRCIAENALGRDFHDITVKVLYAPEFLQSKKEKQDNPLEVKEGEKVTFSCRAVGFPPPVIIWTKNYQPIAYSKNVYLSEGNELVISRANEYDAGLYTCDVTSVLATLQRNFTLIVYAPPTITPPDFEPALDVLEGQLVELPCSARGHPKPEVIWLQNGALVTEDRKYIDEFGLRFVANLTDFGEYTCVARSKYGSTSVNYTIFIWVAPYIEPPLKTTVNAVLSANVTLNCDATGFPIPAVVWEFRGQILTENTTDLSYNDVGNIYITNASSKHDGIYTCIAENFVGIATKAIILNINEPPKILNDDFSGSYVATNRDTALAISCRTAGKPKPFVAWVKDDLHYLDKDTRYDIDIDGTLTIKAPSEELTGLYTCVAKNNVGSANRTVTVKIYPLLQRMQADESQNTITVLEGTNSSIKCPSHASDDDTVKWYKDAKLISNGYLKFYNISRKNASTYACVVTNGIGSFYSSVHINVEWPPVFIDDDEDRKENVEVIKGDDWYFDCGVDSNPKAQTQWLFNSKPLLSENKERLKLINIDLYHSGIYKCVVSNVHGTVARQFVLDVLEPPFISDFDLLDVQLNEGSNATLECNAKGSPTPDVKWIFNNTKWHLINSTLMSTNLTKAFEGLFTCVAANKAGSKRLVYRVQVVAQARVEEVVLYRGGGGESVEGGIQVPVGNRIRISCVASGNPLPKIQWFKNGRRLAQNSRNISYADMIFDHVEMGNTGIYSCVAVNEGGVDKRNIKLDVLEPPKILQNLFLNSTDSTNGTDMEVMSGQPFYLHCHPYGSPAPSVYWFRDGQPLRFFEDTMVSTDYGEVIEVKSAEIGQSGNYTCVAKSGVGEASLVYLVDVLVSPSAPKESTKTIASRVSRPLNLTCPVEGSPLPRVTWIKHPYTKLGEGRVQLFHDNYTLFINNTEVKDSGKYSCIMTNKVGSSEVTFNVIVEQPPYIAGDVEERYVVLWGRSVVLKCQAGGNPAPKVVWLKDNQKLGENVHHIPDGSAVVVWTASSQHAGQYVCVAMNDAGTARARYDVIVKVGGKWSAWSQWSLCNATCGLGYQVRSRSCRYFDDYTSNVTYDKSSDYLILDKSSCKGASNEKRKCHMPACEEEEPQRWSPWSKWSKCSASCGVGTQVRSRRCWNTPCVGDNVQLKKCPNLPTCNGDQTLQNEVFSEESLNNSSPFIPEAVFEMQPDIINPERPSDVEEIYVNPDSKLPAAVYDVRVSENLDGSARGPCDPGFSFNDTTQQCEDIDECLVERNQCHSSQLCVNTVGAYSCACAPGFTSLGAGQRCLDINECAMGTHGCSHACVNVAGGYVCACAPHMRLAPDRHTCVLPSSIYRPYEDLENDEYLSSSLEFSAAAKYKD